MKTLVSVVVPCYNEEANIPLLAGQIEAAFDGLPVYDYEALFVNDGSSDGTHAALERLRADNPRIRPIHLVENRGQSAALVAGLRRAKGEYILTLDGDLQNDPCDFPRFLDLLKHYDCVCGYRADRQDSWLRKASSRVANFVRNAILRDGVRDSACGAKSLRRSCIEHILPFNGAHRFIAAMVQSAGLTVTECPVTHHPRLHGVAKYGVHNRLWRGIHDLFGVRWLRKRYVTFRVDGED